LNSVRYYGTEDGNNHHLFYEVTNIPSSAQNNAPEREYISNLNLWITGFNPI